MRILAVADLHYSLQQFDWVAENMGGCDLLVLAGDLLDLGSQVDLDIQEEVVRRYLRKFSRHITVVASSGNHDIGEPTRNGERVALWLERLKSPSIFADYSSFEKDGTLFSICPWWDGPITMERTASLLAEDAAKDKKAWIWLHHFPPQGTGVAWTGKTDGGDPQIREWIGKYQPDFVFSGHIHHAPFYSQGDWNSKLGKTWIFNAGRQPGRIPTRIVLDLTRGQAEWTSSEGIETIEIPPLA